MKNYEDDYEAGVIDSKILLEIQLELDPFKTISMRESTGILDYMGDTGGFYASLDICFYMVG